MIWLQNFHFRSSTISKFIPDFELATLYGIYTKLVGFNGAKPLKSMDWRSSFRGFLSKGDREAEAIFSEYRRTADDVTFKKRAEALIGRGSQKAPKRGGNRSSATSSSSSSSGPTPVDADAYAGTAMVRFRQMLKGGDAQAQAIHAAFRASGDRDVFLQQVTAHTAQETRGQWARGPGHAAAATVPLPGAGLTGRTAKEAHAAQAQAARHRPIILSSNMARREQLPAAQHRSSSSSSSSNRRRRRRRDDGSNSRWGSNDEAIGRAAAAAAQAIPQPAENGAATAKNKREESPDASRALSNLPGVHLDNPPGTEECEICHIPEAPAAGGEFPAISPTSPTPDRPGYRTAAGGWSDQTQQQQQQQQRASHQAQMTRQQQEQQRRQRQHQLLEQHRRQQREEEEQRQLEEQKSAEEALAAEAEKSANALLRRIYASRDTAGGEVFEGVIAELRYAADAARHAPTPEGSRDYSAEEERRRFGRGDAAVRAAQPLRRVPLLLRVPAAEHQITGTLFGMLVRQKLVPDSPALGVALRYVLDALHDRTSDPAVDAAAAEVGGAAAAKALGGRMYRCFGIFALRQFVPRLMEWPHFCGHLLHARRGAAPRARAADASSSARHDAAGRRGGGGARAPAASQRRSGSGSSGSSGNGCTAKLIADAGASSSSSSSSSSRSFGAGRRSSARQNKVEAAAARRQQDVGLGWEDSWMQIVVATRRFPGRNRRRSAYRVEAASTRIARKERADSVMGMLGLKGPRRPPLRCCPVRIQRLCRR